MLHLFYLKEELSHPHPKFGESHPHEDDKDSIPATGRLSEHDHQFPPSSNQFCTATISYQIQHTYMINLNISLTIIIRQAPIF